MLYHILSTLDNIIDIIKYNARSALKFEQEMDKTNISILEKINQSIRDYYELFYKFDKEKVTRLNKNRYAVEIDIRKNLKKATAEEDYLLISMEQILELILDITEARTALDF